MKGLREMFSSDKRIFAGKQRLHKEPFCPFVTNDTGYHALHRNRSMIPYNPNALSNTGSFNPIVDINQKRPTWRHNYW